MCGIAGVINYSDINLDALKRSLRHRGPDAQTSYVKDNVALVHTRLSIQDLQHGAQPFHYLQYSIIFNGEIYNHLQLRQLLPSFTFLTNSDTETLLYLYIQFGEKMYELIDGMYAFCIYDRNRKCLILARDRAGKKPIYYYKNNDQFLFASELNALRQIKRFSILPDAINCYLRTGYVWRPFTVYEDVFEIEAGSYLTIDTATLNITTKKTFDVLDYYSQPKLKLNLEQAAMALEEKLKKSVADRLTSSDVEVGAFLSGGIDSGLIVAFAAQANPKLKTFTVKFDGSYDEAPLAKLVAEKYQTIHTELKIESNLKEDIEKIILSYGEPFMDSSAIPSYYVSKAAREHLKVVLNGDGADELFGGYRRYVLAAKQLMKYLSWMSSGIKFFPKPRNKQSLYNYFYRTLSSANKQGLDFYVSVTSDIYEDYFKFNDNKVMSSFANFVNKVYENESLSALSKLMCVDFNAILFSDLLVKMDIATMVNSLEARSPFLSKYLLEFAPTLPDSYKIRNVSTKYILRYLAKKYLPEELIEQPKRGFEVPLSRWVENELKEPIYDSLRMGCYAENYLPRRFIQDLLEKKNDIPLEKRAKMLWSLYCLEVWHAKEAKNNIYW